MEKMTIYLKSVNVIELDGVSDWKVTETGGKFNGINLTQSNEKKRLIVKSLDLDSVEAITVEPIV